MALALAALVWVQAGIALAGRLDPETEYTARVLYVVDGDTLKVKVQGEKVSIRLIGIDTPESKANARSRKQAEEFGKSQEEVVRMGRVARAFVEAELRHVKEVRIRTHKKAYDRYDRVLAAVYLPDGDDLSEKILRSGFGLPYEIKPFTARRETYAEAHRQAREARRGLWRTW
ncbi:MAG: thermonuclease family protein [Nitrospirae bacterium]|nr:thermonuclease family protein [Nitrospirota bacterium]